MKYKLIDHTADFGIHVFGSNAKTLFSNAAYAMFDLITEIETLKGLESAHVKVSGDDWPDLMVNWLREVLFFWNGREKLVKETLILSLSENELTAKVDFDPYVPGHNEIKTEIKAVTYHQIHVNSGPVGWEAKVIFDV